ncbi:unnamed protein product [Vitrella brassicaformis CCMP3155]|uniref:Uncharacterized protein n=1 Tax=Vitrella brassicaformis (strain CCMP3155) TaxID=1169540 RepID=A0A0G4FHL8_VITBC|nr:unnamed protein product [Vitrella brassicaformis CCMP3155]|eukprot:CEM12930.1 unnamed protein product [Vitrella brassicaformis CCMP3155]
MTSSLLELGLGAQTSDENAVVPLEGCVAPTEPLDPSLGQESRSSIAIRTPTLAHFPSSLLGELQGDGGGLSRHAGACRASDGRRVGYGQEHSLMVSEAAEQLHRRGQGDLQSFANKYLNKDNQQTVGIGCCSSGSNEGTCTRIRTRAIESLALTKDLLECLKRDLFSWVDSLQCDLCGGKTSADPCEEDLGRAAQVPGTDMRPHYAIPKMMCGSREQRRLVWVQP